MEKLLQLLNEYEDTRWTVIDDWLTEEERENWAIIEELPTWREYDWHIRHCNANTVAFEKDTFDAYVFSKRYGFIKWLWDNHKLEAHDVMKNAILDQIREWHEWEAYTQWLVLSDNPISDLISYLN